MRFHLLLTLCVLPLTPMSAHAGKAKRLYKLMDEGKYQDALRKGVTYLETDKVRPDEKEIRLIMERAAYFIATENNEVRAYKTYLRSFPRSAYVSRVKEQLAQLEYEALLEQKASLNQLRSFQKNHPQSTWIDDVRIREEEQAWTETRREGSVQAIQRYKDRYPSGHFIRAAVEEEASQAYRIVQSSDDLESYTNFLREYPGTRFTPEARDRSEELAWVKAERSNNVEGYKEFRNTFQDGPRVKEAYGREVDLSWSTTKETHKIPLYRQFGRDYASHDLALEAEKREWDLYHYERDPYPGELVPQVTRTVREEDGSYRLFLDVKDDRDRYVGGLGTNNFEIYDSGFPAELLSLEGMEADRPADVIFVIDVSGSMADEINGVREGIKRLADLMTLRSRDLRLGLVTFVEQIYQVNGRPNGGPLTPSHAEFGKWVDAAKLETGAEENDYLALHVAAHQRFRRKAQRILVLVTDEPPSTTRQFPNSTMVSEFLQAQDTTVYCVAPSHLSAYRNISKATGGAVFNLNRTIPFTEVMETLGQKISKQYRLRYRRPPEAPPVLDELNVRIRINREHAWVQRSGNAATKGVGTTLVAISPHDSRNVFRGLTTGG
ncbi:MAG: VWA domain-containing protein, partial [Myxococcota bacterium]